MKKLLIIALCAAFAGIASAASINWQVKDTRNTFLWDSSNAKGNYTTYLVLASDVSTITTPTEDKTFDQLLAANKIDEVSTTSGAYKTSNPAERVATSSKLTAGQKYTFQLLTVDSNGKYALSSALEQFAYTTDSQAEQYTDATSVTFTAGMLGAAAQAGSTTWNDKPVYQGGGGGDQPAVPEPATGALALAGVALLFKRRRA